MLCKYCNVNNVPEYRLKKHYYSCNKCCNTKYYRGRTPGAKLRSRCRRACVPEAEIPAIIERLQQTTCCEICQRPFDTTHKKYGCLDHCHATGKFRGIICDDCNVGLARFGDCPKRLTAAAKYLAARAMDSD